MVTTFSCSCLLLFSFVLTKKNLRLIAFVSLNLAGQTFSKFRAASHVRKLSSQFPACTIIYSYPEIQYGGQNVISFVLSCHRSKICQKDSPHQNVFKLTLSQKSFYVFRKDRQCKFIFLLSPSLDLINIISVWLLKQ